MNVENASPVSMLPYLTADLPGVGGAIKLVDDDFLVEELPRYEPCGEGTHVFFMIEKRHLATLAVVRQFAKRLDRQARDVGYAGMKDVRGITRQVLSLEHIDPAEIMRLDVPGVKVLWAKRHTNKLKLGHLSGNRFAIKIRGFVETPLDRVQSVFDVLASRGIPNYYGPQRFGIRGYNAVIGKAVVLGDYAQAIGYVLGQPMPNDSDVARTARTLFDAGRYEESAAAWPGGFAEESRLCRAVIKTGGLNAKAWRQLDQKVRKLYVAALQSDLFNRVVADRIDRLDRLETGDLAWKHRNGACFTVEDAAIEQPRCTAFEISPTGPMFGAKMTAATGEPGERENRVLADAGVAFDQGRTPDGIRMDGARRPLRVPIADKAVMEGSDKHGPFLQLSFSLPSGSYATAVVREVCKTDTAEAVGCG